MTYGDKIKEFAIEKYGSKGSLTKLAEALGTTMPNLAQYIYNRSQPGSPLLKKLHDLGMDLNWFFSLEDQTAGIVKEKIDSVLTYRANSEIADLEKKMKEFEKQLKKLKQIINR